MARGDSDTDAVFVERRQVVQIVIRSDGVAEPPDAVQLIREDRNPEGQLVRYFLCLTCQEIVDGPDGVNHTHTCEEEPADLSEDASA